MYKQYRNYELYTFNILGNCAYVVVDGTQVVASGSGFYDLTIAESRAMYAIDYLTHIDSGHI